MMLDRLRSLFFDESEPEAAISTDLAAATLMFEVIWADHDIDEDELEVMREHLVSAFSVSPQRLDELLMQTRRLHDESVGLHPYTRVLNDELGPDQKFQIVKALWKIASVDTRVDALEEHMIRRIADLLYVSHKDFIRAKLEVRNPG